MQWFESLDGMEDTHTQTHTHTNTHTHTHTNTHTLLSYGLPFLSFYKGKKGTKMKTRNVLIL
jgi:hypothetical protein